MGQAKRRGSREERVQNAIRLKDEGIETNYWKLKRETKERKEMIQQQRAEQKKMLELLGIGITPTPGFTPNHPRDPKMIRIRQAREAFIKERQEAEEAARKAKEAELGDQPVAATEAILPLDKNDIPLTLSPEQTEQILASPAQSSS